jgi:hypothetical protein
MKTKLTTKPATGHSMAWFRDPQGRGTTELNLRDQGVYNGSGIHSPRLCSGR